MSAVKPRLWTPAEFVAETGAKDVRKALAGIDALLTQWDGIKDGPSQAGRVQVLKQLIHAASTYLTAKEGKKAKKDAARFGKASSRLTNRITKVKTLSGQVFLRLAYEQYEYQKGVRTQVSRSLQAASGNAADLKGSYKHERSNFTATKGGQHLAGTQTAINPQGASFVHQKMEEHEGNPVAAPPNIIALLNKDFNALSLAEFNQLQAHFAGGAQGLGHLPNVHFARKDERFRELMLIPLDGVLHTSDGNICNAGWNAYAVDTYGNLLVAKANKAWNHGASGAQFNHSTLTAGRDVICAGEIRIVNGAIKYISNESGHYKPSAAQLANAIFVLVDEYTLPLLQTVEDVVDISMGHKLTHKGVLAFLGANPTVVRD